MKNRSARVSSVASFRCSAYAETTLALCARHQECEVGYCAKDCQKPTARDDGVPGRSPVSATASQPSRRICSLTARHHGLPGCSPVGGRSTPRANSHRMADVAARRNGRWRGALPYGP